MRDGRVRVGEKRPFAMERRRELVGPSGGAELGPARTPSRVSTTPVSMERALDGGGETKSSPSGGDSSSTLMWKSGRLGVDADGRRRGREPRDACAPGPRSSLKDERWRRCCWGWTAARALVDAAGDEEEGSAGVAYGMAAAAAGGVGSRHRQMRGVCVLGDDMDAVSWYINSTSVLWEIPGEIRKCRGEIPREHGGILVDDTGILDETGILLDHYRLGPRYET